MNSISLIPHPGSLNLVLTRLFTKGEYTHGSLSIDGIKICSTLENANALVPAGDYTIRLAKCKQYSRKMLLLNPKAPCLKCPKLKLVTNNSVLPCYCPMLKPGNGVCGRLDGSILVGQRNCLGCLVHPKDAFDSLYERIRKSLSRGNEVILTIKDIPSARLCRLARPRTLHSHPSTLYFV